MRNVIRLAGEALTLYLDPSGDQMEAGLRLWLDEPRNSDERFLMLSTFLCVGVDVGVAAARSGNPDVPSAYPDAAAWSDALRLVSLWADQDVDGVVAIWQGDGPVVHVPAQGQRGAALLHYIRSAVTLSGMEPEMVTATVADACEDALRTLDA